jgi:hypothetical protein
MRITGVLALALCASGCDYLFQIDRVTLAGDAQGDRDDGRADGSSPGLCTSTVVDDTFDGAMTCPWGVTFGGTYVTSGGGHLTVSPPADNFNGGCDAPIGPFADGGIVAEITQVIEGSSYAYTGIEAFGTFDTSIQVNDGLLKFEDPSASSLWAQDEYDPVAMRWVRIRPDRGTNEIVGEYSSDGKTWALLGTVSTQIPVTVKPTLIGGVAQGAPTITGVAEFSRFIVCL